MKNNIEKKRDDTKITNCVNVMIDKLHTRTFRIGNLVVVLMDLEIVKTAGERVVIIVD